MRLAIVGTGGMGREVADIARRAGRSSLVFVTDDPGPAIDGIAVIGPDQLLDDDELVFAVGSGEVRKRFAERFHGRPCGALVSAHALVSPSARIGEGAVICDFAVINNAVEIGRHFQCNTFAQVSHDCVIGDFVTFSPRTTCNGTVRIEDGVFVGAGAIIRNGSPDRPMTIGRGAVIGMGAVVTKSVPPGVTVIGNPARPLAR